MLSSMAYKNASSLPHSVRVTLFRLFHPLFLRSCLSEWFPSTAWAASGPSATRRKTETWRPASAPPSPSSTLSPTVSSPRSSGRPRPALPLPPPSPPPPLTSRTPPRPPAHLAALTPVLHSGHASSRGGSILLRSEPKHSNHFVTSSNINEQRHNIYVFILFPPCRSAIS